MPRNGFIITLKTICNLELFFYMLLDAVSLVWLFHLQKTRWHTFFCAQYLYFLPTADFQLHLHMLWKWLDLLSGIVTNTLIEIMLFLRKHYGKYCERIIKISGWCSYSYFLFYWNNVKLIDSVRTSRVAFNADRDKNQPSSLNLLI